MCFPFFPHQTLVLGGLLVVVGTVVPGTLNTVQKIEASVGPKTPLDPIPADRAKEYFKDNPMYMGRHNGVLLEGQVSVEAKATPPEIRLKWTIDYNGPRQPLAILKPSITNPTGEQTAVVFGARGTDNQIYICVIKSQEAIGPYIAAKSYFITVPQGKKSLGHDRHPGFGHPGILQEQLAQTIWR